ncbi:RNA polymerase sigma factor [Egicoccus sp. AB-alg2]|uniref:RNA polymerase sigma factor n=1 Tax=Egicoccus sp. AB-alg2 TaxID=3242693 RepID=UPI00359D9FD5
MSAPAELVAFVHRERPRLVRAVELLLDDRAVAEEIAQEALVRACSHWERVSTLASPGGWAHRVAINLASSQLRRRRLERRARSRVARDDVHHEPDTATSLLVREALAALSARQRRVLVLRHVLGWSAAEIGDHEGASAEAIRQQLHRARDAMRRHLEMADPQEEHTDVR